MFTYQTKTEEISGPIYAVYAIHTDRNYLLGYATGKVEDIRAYFDDQKVYGLEIKVVKWVHVPANYAEDKSALVAKRNALQKQVDELDRQIKSAV